MDQQALTDAVKALERAAVNEWYGYRFYMTAMEHTEHERGQALFRGLAEDETEHLHIILAEREALLGGKPWLTYEEAVATPVQFDITGPNPFPEASKGMQMLFPPVKEVEGMVDQFATDVSAMEMALQFEKAGYDMYQQQADLASDPKAREAYRILAKEENRHYTWIQQSLEYLKANKTWWDSEELPFFEG